MSNFDIRLPKSVLYLAKNKYLTRSESMVLAHIVGISKSRNCKDGLVRIRHSTIAEHLGISKKTSQRSIRKLKAAELLDNVLLNKQGGFVNQFAVMSRFKNFADRYENGVLEGRDPKEAFASLLPKDMVMSFMSPGTFVSSSGENVSSKSSKRRSKNLNDFKAQNLSDSRQMYHARGTFCTMHVAQNVPCCIKEFPNKFIKNCCCLPALCADEFASQVKGEFKELVAPTGQQVRENSVKGEFLEGEKKNTGEHLTSHVKANGKSLSEWLTLYANGISEDNRQILYANGNAICQWYMAIANTKANDNGNAICQWYIPKANTNASGNYLNDYPLYSKRFPAAAPSKHAAFDAMDAYTNTNTNTNTNSNAIGNGMGNGMGNGERAYVRVSGAASHFSAKGVFLGPVRAGRAYAVSHGRVCGTLWHDMRHSLTVRGETRIGVSLLVVRPWSARFRSPGRVVMRPRIQKRTRRSSIFIATPESSPKLEVLCGANQGLGSLEVGMRSFSKADQVKGLRVKPDKKTIRSRLFSANANAIYSVFLEHSDKTGISFAREPSINVGKKIDSVLKNYSNFGFEGVASIVRLAVDNWEKYAEGIGCYGPHVARNPLAVPPEVLFDVSTFQKWVDAYQSKEGPENLDAFAKRIIDSYKMEGKRGQKKGASPQTAEQQYARSRVASNQVDARYTDEDYKRAGVSGDRKVNTEHQTPLTEVESRREVVVGGMPDIHHRRQMKGGGIAEAVARRKHKRHEGTSFFGGAASQGSIARDASASGKENGFSDGGEMDDGEAVEGVEDGV